MTTVRIGGMLCGAVLAWGGLLRDEALGVVGTLGFGMVATLWGVVFDGVLGLAEGMVLGLPLATVLGAFGDPARCRPSTGRARKGRRVVGHVNLEERMDSRRREVSR